MKVDLSIPGGIMHATVLSVWMLASIAATPLEVKFVQVAPASEVEGQVVRSPDHDRAVVLIQGLFLHPFSDRHADRAAWQGWQRPSSRIVTVLGEDADVYSVAYSQNCPVEAVAASDEFAEIICHLEEAGYDEIVLIGHSAGGLVARHFVEDHPHSGVTKVIQVCTPNGGSSWGNLDCGVCERQEVFLASLTRHARSQCLAERRDKQIPEHVEFACVVGQYEFTIDWQYSVDLWGGRTLTLAANKDFRGDGIVSSVRQWTPELQEQGIPAVAVPVSHVRAMRSRMAIDAIAKLVREPQPRQSPAEMSAMRAKILGESALAKQ